MTTRVTVTGTGIPRPAPNRAGAGVLVQADGFHLQFDAGRNTVARLVSAGTLPEQLDGVFLTHYHSDHLLGLQDVVHTRWLLDHHDALPALPIVAPAGPTSRFCERMLDVWVDDLEVRALHAERNPRPNIEVVAFETPAELTEVWSGGDVRVLAGPVRHEPVQGAVGYRIETGDGTVAISGDTRVCDEVAALASGADIVVHEAMRMEKILELAPHLHFFMKYHSDTRLLGQQAAELDIPVLMLTHLSPPPFTDADRQGYVDEVREGGYRGEIVVCDDLDWREIG